MKDSESCNYGNEHKKLSIGIVGDFCAGVEFAVVINLETKRNENPIERYYPLSVNGISKAIEHALQNTHHDKPCVTLDRRSTDYVIARLWELEKLKNVEKNKDSC